MRLWFARHRPELMIALLLLLIAGPIVEIYGIQQSSRYTFTAAMWDERTIKLDTYAAIKPNVLGPDRSFRDGHTYSDKPPLQPLLAVPAYATYRAVGGEPATELRMRGNLGLWWVKFWSAAVPGAILAALMHRWLSRRTAGSVAATVAIGGGTMLLPFSSVLFGHAMAALFVFLAFYLLTSNATARRLLGAGAAAGAAVTTEYTAVIGIAVLAIYTLWRYRSQVIYFVAGGVPFVALLAAYNWVAFGSPLSLSYQWTSIIGTTDESRELLFAFSGPSWSHLQTLLFAGRGLVVATPVIVLALVGLVMKLRGASRDDRAVALTALVVFLGFMALPVFWANQWGGGSPGARYMTPAMPFLIVGVPAALGRLRLLTWGAIVVSVTTMVAATITYPLIGPNQAADLGVWLAFLKDIGPAETVFTMALGDLTGWVVHLGLIAAAVWSLYRVTHPASLPTPVPR